MAESVTVARPYAEAIFKLARERNALTAWSAQLRLLELVLQDDRVREFVRDPKQTPAAVEQLLLVICGERLDASGRNLVQVLVQNNRLEVIESIRALYEARKAEQEGVVEATIRSAVALDQDQQARLVHQLEVKYQRKVKAKVEVDAELLGGCRITVGDRVIDYTVRAYLDAMAMSLAR